MWKPEEIRDAEDVALDSTHDAGPEFVMVEKDTWTRAVRLAGDVLKHRSDYDGNCEPLPSNDAFLQSLGMSRDDRELWEHPDIVGCFVLGFDGVVEWHVDVHQVCEIATRPQLRLLLESLGVQNNPPAREEGE